METTDMNSFFKAEMHLPIMLSSRDSSRKTITIPYASLPSS